MEFSTYAIFSWPTLICLLNSTIITGLMFGVYGIMPHVNRYLYQAIALFIFTIPNALSCMLRGWNDHSILLDLQIGANVLVFIYFSWYLRKAFAECRRYTQWKEKIYAENPGLRERIQREIANELG